MAVLFISEDYVKNNSIIDDNVDMKLILPSIRDCQELRVLPILGTPLYEDLITKISAVPTTLTADDIKLLDDYIAPCMLQWTIYECTVSMLFKYRNKSVATKRSENSTHIDYEQLQFLRDEWKNKAQEREARMINYLCDNETLYPKYTATSNDLYPKKMAFQTKFYLGSGGGDCWRGDFEYYK